MKWITVRREVTYSHAPHEPRQNTTDEGKTSDHLTHLTWGIFQVVEIISSKCCRAEGTSAEAPSVRMIYLRARTPAGTKALIQCNSNI